MQYKISKSKYLFLNSMLAGRANTETVEISDEEFNELQAIQSSLSGEREDANYKLTFEEKLLCNSMDGNFWITVPKGPSYWNINMGGSPEVMSNQSDGKFVRFNVIDNNDGTFLASGVKSANAWGDGKFECEARFKGGKGSWPAIWMTHPGGSANNNATYYEIDLSEYYETRNETETTYHCPQSVNGGEKYVDYVKTTINKNDWNKFVCTWDSNSIVIYINNVAIMTIPNDGDSTHFPTTKSNRTFSIILSMQYAGNPWLQSPDSSELPLYMDVRNIKYWTKK